MAEAIKQTKTSAGMALKSPSFIDRVGTNLSVTMPSALGKWYQLQSIPALGNGTWSNLTTEASVVARTGSVVTLTAPMSGAAKYFRVSISDVDTDGDGVNDWEGYQLGLDPTQSLSVANLTLSGGG